MPRVAVVVDVLRAFTVAAWAFARGAERIVLARSAAEALALKAENPGWLALKDGAPVEGFDAVNSPGYISSADLTGRTVVQKTTAGTVGALAVADADMVLCASFVVAGATAKALRSVTGPVTFVVTGEDGLADEDRACAEYIARRCPPGASVDAGTYVRRARESRAARELATGIRRGYRGVHARDVQLCLEVDRFGFAMAARREGPLLVLRPVPDAGP
ncbi:2-phosphosulfolactate phosphatase [Streptomyces roseicoloratus]|uniref:Probable 2-phosphosulfolactate phosphatase n=1 Tax=Streptomyces roseicoloratus TaxID=2508722 RepID=A0ABY9S3X5_9ACTN|nr:2-phosphosulfolactate phosphatase [Streptomyces roseicoloratus]WMX48638.1 2-phosphosulfolactate phosphatase [Streptomyces roseicoloratus]